MRRIGVVLLLGCLLAGVVAAAPASACSCAGGTTAEFFARADAVFTGSLAARSVGTVDSSIDPALHVFTVETVFKGSAHERQGVVSPVSGASCGLELTGNGPFAVFATRDADLGDTAFTTLAEGQYAAFLCGGTTELTPALEAELRTLAARETAPHEATPRPGAAGTELADGRPTTALLAVAAVVVLGSAAVLLGRRLRRRSRSGGLPHG
jgi:hypothetical protein